MSRPTGPPIEVAPMSRVIPPMINPIAENNSFMIFIISENAGIGYGKRS